MLSRLIQTGETPLHNAAARGHLEIAKMLLEAGTSPTITDIVSIQEYTLPQSVFIVYSVFPKGVHLCFIELFPLMWLLNEFLHCLGKTLKLYLQHTFQ